MRILRAAMSITACALLLTAAKPPVKSKEAKKPKVVLTPEQRTAQAILNKLSLHDRVAQLVIGVCYGEAPSTKSAEYQKYRHWVRDLHIGGLIVNNRVDRNGVRNAQPHAMALFLNQMQKLSKTALIVGGDFERGSSMRVAGGTLFPFNMAYGAAQDLDGVRYEALQTAREARALGVQWIFAPVADVNNNPANPVINTRSFGENPQDVSKFVNAYIEGAHSDPKNPVLVTVKHFPGHGDTDIDSHLALARVGASKERMEAVELMPFRAAIAHGVDAVMTAHLAVPAFEPDDIPATVSSKVLTGLLRNELGFKNLIVTDAMDMQGLAKQFPQGEASVRALEAGADVLLMPPNPETAIRAVIAAIENKRLTRQRVEESVLRILTAKVHLGILKKKTTDLDELSDIFDSPEAALHAQQTSDRAITLIRNDRDLVPVAAQNSPCLIEMVDRRQGVFGQKMLDEFRRRAPKAQATIVDASMPTPELAASIDAAQCSTIVVATFATVMPGGEMKAYLEALSTGPKPVVLISMGNPYLLAAFPKVAGYMDSFSPTPPSETSAIKALFGEIPITGHMPVTIPGFAKFGEGIQLAARAH